MVDQDVLSARLNALETYSSELRPFQAISEERYVKEPGLHHLAERYLAPFGQLLATAELVQVGKGTTFGLVWVAVE